MRSVLFFSRIVFQSLFVWFNLKIQKHSKIFKFLKTKHYTAQVTTKTRTKTRKKNEERKIKNPNYLLFKVWPANSIFNPSQTENWLFFQQSRWTEDDWGYQEIEIREVDLCLLDPLSALTKSYEFSDLYNLAPLNRTNTITLRLRQLTEIIIFKLLPSSQTCGFFFTLQTCKMC